MGGRVDNDILEGLRDAAAARLRLKAKREDKHEAVRRQHRMTAAAGGGERECSRRRKQEYHLLSKWHYEGLPNDEIQRLLAIRRAHA